MDLFTSQDTASQQLVSPLVEHLDRAEYQYACRRISDQSWLSHGVARALCDLRSGCGFLQHIGFASEWAIGKSTYFEAFKSKRRLSHLNALGTGLVQSQAHRVLRENPDANMSAALSKFHLYAGDGHFHAASTHDQRDGKGRKNAVGHLYALNMRNNLLSHLALGSTKTKRKPNDMGVLKRTEIATLRQGAKAGEKVLYVWDRAGIDFLQWHKWKQGSGIYFLSREKENMALDVIGIHPWERENRINAGIKADQLVATTRGVAVRRVIYTIPETGETMSYLTNLPTSIEPGVVAHLYFMRWRIEKSFDEIKNKIYETKAWASGETAKKMQAAFTCLAYNLARLLSVRREVKNQIDESDNESKRDKRMRELGTKVKKRGGQMPLLRQRLQEPTQLSVKFYRWLRYCIEHMTCWRSSLDSLRRVYAKF